jgi:hypothetical protein
MFGQFPFGSGYFGDAGSSAPPNQFSGSAAGDSDATVVLIEAGQPGSALPKEIWAQLIKGKLPKKRSKVDPEIILHPVEISWVQFSGSVEVESYAAVVVAAFGNAKARARCSSRSNVKTCATGNILSLGEAESYARGETIGRFRFRADTLEYEEELEDTLSAMLILMG